MEAVNELCDLLQSHPNRDKVVSLASYIIKLWAATAERKELLTASSRLALARSTLRLFDDAAALKTLQGHLFRSQDGPVWRTLGIVNSVFTLSCLQAEKVVWLIDSGVLTVSEEVDYNARTAHKLFWSLFSFVGFLRSIRFLHASASTLKSSERSTSATARYQQACLTTTKLLCDIIHAVSWLPRGWLWGKRLSVQKQCSYGIASAVLGLVIHYNDKRLASAK